MLKTGAPGALDDTPLPIVHQKNAEGLVFRMTIALFLCDFKLLDKFQNAYLSLRMDR